MQRLIHISRFAALPVELSFGSNGRRLLASVSPLLNRQLL
jgi:hypothetical protein